MCVSVPQSVQWCVYSPLFWLQLEVPLHLLFSSGPLALAFLKTTDSKPGHTPLMRALMFLFFSPTIYPDTDTMMFTSLGHIDFSASRVGMLNVFNAEVRQTSGGFLNLVSGSGLIIYAVCALCKNSVEKTKAHPNFCMWPDLWDMFVRVCFVPEPTLSVEIWEMVWDRERCPVLVWRLLNSWFWSVTCICCEDKNKLKTHKLYEAVDQYHIWAIPTSSPYSSSNNCYTISIWPCPLSLSFILPWLKVQAHYSYFTAAFINKGLASALEVSQWGIHSSYAWAAACLKPGWVIVWFWNVPNKSLW